jgi:hypothetical protein
VKRSPSPEESGAAGNVSSSRKFFYVALLLLLLIAFFIDLRATDYPLFPVDDAYTTLHNAEVLQAGEDKNFGDVSPLTGATSAVHLVLVAGLLNFFPSAWASFAAAWIAAVLYALALAYLAFVHRASPLLAAMVVVVGLGVGLTLHQLFNGLETGLAMAGLTWALALTSAPEGRPRWPRLLLYGQLPFLRPELAAAVVLFWLFEAWRHWRETGSGQHMAKAVAFDIGITLLAAAPWLLWYQASLGVPMPTSVEAKRLFFSEGCLPSSVKLSWTAETLVRFAKTADLLVVGFVLLFGSRLGWVGVAFTAIFLLAYYILFPGALGHYEQRYMYVLVPVLVFGLVSHLSSSSQKLMGGITAVLILVAAQSIWNGSSALETNRANSKFTQMELDALAAWCRDNLPSDAVLLVHDVGYISHATDFRLVDFVGLKTPSSVGFHRSITWPTSGQGRGEAVHEIALGSRPDYLVMLSGWDEIYNITDSLRARGWRLDEVRRPQREEGYSVYRLGIPVSTGMSR